MQIHPNTKYILSNGYTVTFKRTSLPYYRWKADVESGHEMSREVWTDEGIAYHDDCGYNVREEVPQGNQD